MALIVFGSLSGSPGVTTAALATAAAWPHDRPVLLEADVKGGDLAARFGMAVVPGLTGLAADLRHGTSPDLLAKHGQPIEVAGVKVPVVLAPPGPVQARAAVAALAAGGGTVWRHDAVAIADCGRLDPGGPGWQLASHADAVVVLVAANPDAVTRLLASLAALRQVAAERLHLVVTEGAYPAADVADTLDTPVTATLPADEKAAAVMAGQMLPGRRYPRLAYPAAIAELAQNLAGITARAGTSPIGAGT